MSDSKHSIELEQVVFTRSVVIAVPGHQPNEQGQKANIGAENTINSRPIDGEEGKYQVSMTSKLNINGDIAYPYIVDMECVGVFSIESTLSHEDAVRRVTITAHSVLYGAIREAVAWLTGRQPFGPLILGLSILQAPPTKTT